MASRGKPAAVTVQPILRGAEVFCPRCGMDVMVVGFTVVGDHEWTYMRFSGGLMQIAEKQCAAETAYCGSCEAPLGLAPCDLMRAA